jgi:5,10-methylenetetrahydrofolate reductase
MACQNNVRGATKLSNEEKASKEQYRNLGIKAAVIITFTDRNEKTIIRILEKFRVLAYQSILQRKKGPGRPQKMMNSLLRCL